MRTRAQDKVLAEEVDPLSVLLDDEQAWEFDHEFDDAPKGPKMIKAERDGRIYYRSEGVVRERMKERR